MADVISLKHYRNALKTRRRANELAQAGAGVDEDIILEAANRWHLAVLEQRLGGGGIQIHLGMARGYRGVAFCVGEAAHQGAPMIWARESLGAFRSPYFSMKLPEDQRWWCGIVWLEQNRGCPSCIRLAYQFADENGWKQPRRLGELLELGSETLGPARGSSSSTGPRITARGFERGTG